MSIIALAQFSYEDNIMALVLDKATVSIELLGEMKGSRTRTFEVELDAGAADDETRVATAYAAINTLIPLFAALTKAVIVGYNVSLGHVENGAVAVPVDGNVYSEAFYSVGINTAGTKVGNFTVPAPVDSLFVGNDETSGDLDVTDANLLAFVGAFKAPNWFRVSDGEQIVSTPPIIGSKMRSVSSRKSFK